MKHKVKKHFMSWATALVITATILGTAVMTFGAPTIGVAKIKVVEEWRADRVDNRGDQVTFNGTTFEAKWWTQNQEPTKTNEWEPWKVVGEVIPTPNPNTNPNPNQTTTWDPAKAYTSGDRVVVDGITYEAKWWNQNDKPSSVNTWGAWKVIETTKPDLESSSNPVIPAPVDPNLDPVDKDKFKVVGYYPAWQPDKINTIQYDKLTHINYAFAIPTAEGGLLPLENPEIAKKIIAEAHKYGVKVLLAVGGWSYNGTPLENTFIAATSTDAKCKKFANNIVAMMNKYGFDGIDMDWEHPRSDGNTRLQYETLMKYLNEVLKPQGKLLTSAVLSGVNASGQIYWDAAAQTDNVIKYVDWFNVMAYDGGDGDSHSSYQFAVSSVNYWRNVRNMSAEKVVLGVPFYGRPQWKTYEEILAIDPQAYGKDIVNGMYYNGIPTIKKKTEFALQNAGGMMIWELSQDTKDPKKSLLSAIYETIKAAEK